MIAGEGPFEPVLHALARELGIAERVQFTGMLDQEELHALYQSAHLFLHPSETFRGDVEGIPNALLEAMACGLPVVSTRHGGIPEAVTDRVTGLLCEEGNVEQIANAMDLMITDPELYAGIALEAARYVKAHFSQTKQVEQIENLYFSVMQRSA